MSPRRLLSVTAVDLRDLVRRPLFAIWGVFMAWNGYWMSRSAWFYRSVDTSVGTDISWVNSEFQVAFVVALITFFLFGFYVAIAAGTPPIRDRQQGVGELLHATPLSPGEYVWGKFLAAMAGIGAMSAILIGSAMLFCHLLPDAANPGFYGPFQLRSYLLPVVVFLLPAATSLAAAAFAVGVATGRPILVFLVPIVAFFLFNQFYWGWYPPDMDPWWLRFHQHIDVSGFRWLKQNWLLVDRGIAFYNHNPIRYAPAFLASRLAHLLLALVVVDWSRRHLARSLRRPGDGRWQRLLRALRPSRAAATAAAVPRWQTPLATLGMRSGRPGFWRGLRAVARFELTELRAQPGLYIFLPSIVVFVVAVLSQPRGPFGSGLLTTSGTAAIFGLPMLSFWMGVLILFYTAESLGRERATGVASIYHATPVPTAAVLAGKALANGVVMLAIAAAHLIGSLVMIARSPGVPFEAGPFLIVWGVLFPPTFLLWIAYVTAVYALTGSRYATYGVGLGTLALTGWAFLRGHLTWVTNWPLLGLFTWSDLGAFELDRRALVLNRALAVLLAVALAALAWAAWRRRERDRTQPRRLLPRRRAMWLAAAAVAALPAVCAFALWREIENGYQGGRAEAWAKSYWRQNLATWLDAPLPEIDHLELAIDLEPATRGFTVDGSYQLVNRQHHDLAWIPVSGGLYWRDLTWTLDGRPATPEEHSGLYVFQPQTPLAPEQSVRLGFRYRGTLNPGSGRNPGFLPFGELILPSGVVITGRNPDFVPVLGLVAARGVDDDNRYLPRRYPPGFQHGETPASLDRSVFTSRLTITAPEAYTVNATGALVDQVPTGDGRRRWRWETDYPLRVINVIAGRWQVARGNGTAVYYHPGHGYNVDTMVAALDAAREHFSAWFHPYPWQELRLSEFPAYAVYARGNPTNILFSEGVGFTTTTDARVDQAFQITAHEAAHQWWGHIVAHGEGPGGIVLAEGAAHFATMMLLEEVKGPLQRMTFARGIEAFYGENRLPSGEAPLVETYLHRPADTTVVYDKGGWVLWMMMHHLGRERFLEGVQSFFHAYHTSRDHPLLQDFTAALRPFAADPEAYDEFVRQWFFERVMPEYRLMAVDKARDADAWRVTVTVWNAGDARMPVEVAATAGRRFTADGAPDPDYRRCLETLTLGAGETGTVALRCAFEPERVIVDPDVKVFQLQRQAAQTRL